MKVVIVGYMGFDGPGVMHAHHFSNHLVEQGHEVLFLVNGVAASVDLMAEKPRYRLHEIVFENGVLAPHLYQIVKEFSPGLVHIWTPRHVPARVGLEIAVEEGARLVIHFEDDEEFILRHFGGNQSFSEDDVGLYRFLAGEPPDASRLEELAPTVNGEFLRATALDAGHWPWLHPLASSVAVRFADAYTVISDQYKALLDSRYSKPSLLLYPGVDQSRFSATLTSSPELAKRLQLGGRTVLLYSGAIADIHDFPDYLRALPAVVRDHPEVVLLQLGRNDIPEVTAPLVRELNIEQNVIFAGPVSHRDMPEYLALAHVFLAPVRHDEFNKHRLPSKIPEYMAMGRPMLIMDWGFGERLREGDGVVKLRSDGAEEISMGLLDILERRHEWRSMGKRQRAKASELFVWRDNTESLATFYRQVLEQAPPDHPEGLDDASDVYTLDWTGYGELENVTPRDRPGSLAWAPLVPSFFRMMRRWRNRVVRWVGHYWM